MLSRFRKIINSIENYPLTLTEWLISFLSLIILRLLGEYLVNGLATSSFSFFAGSTLVTILFFLFAYLLILIFLKFFLKESVQKMANLLLWGFFLVIFPPIIDKIWCGAQKCWSFYAFDSLKGLALRFLTFFGDNPMTGITYGVRVEVALAVILIALYIFIKTKKVLKSFLGGLATYVILFVLGSFPSWLTFFLLSPVKKISAVEGFDVAGIFLSPVRIFSLRDADLLNVLNVKMNLIYGLLVTVALVIFFWMNFREKFWAVVKNVRWIQISIHVGLILTGAALGAFYFPDNLTLKIGQALPDVFFSLLVLANLVLAAVFAWIASVFLNDQADLEADKVTNTGRPLVSGKISFDGYGQLFWMSFAISLLLSLAVGMKFFLLILAYQIIGWVYSCWPFRLKRFPGIAGFLSALALTLLFSGGFMLLAENQDIFQFPPRVFWLLIVAFMVSLPIKDLKDIEGDRKNNIWTIPALLGETWARFVIGLGIFISYALSVVWLNAKILFFPAMILGALSFWILQNKKISPRRVHIWAFGLLFAYVFLMAYLVFWPMIRFGLN
jgi:4-hydroxybenzoate polyprenyltransferase